MRKNTAIVTVLVLALAAGAWTAVQAGNAIEVRTESFRLLNEGVAAYKRGDYQAAITKLARSASMALSSFRAHYYLGLAYTADRRYLEALNALEIALDLDPLHLGALVATGDAYLRQGDIGEAEAAYYRALRVRPEHPAALDGIARSFDARAKDDRAIEFYQRAIASNRGFAPAYTHLGELYLRIGRLEDAVQTLTEAVTVRPDYAPALNRLSEAFTRIGLYNEAVATIQEAIELQPQEASHHARLGLIQLELGLLARAEETFHRALELDGLNPDAGAGMAEVARRRGEYRVALDYLDTVLGDERLEPRTRVRIEDYRAAVVAERDRIAALEEAFEAGSATRDEMQELAVIYGRRLLWERAVEVESRVGPEGLERQRIAYYLLQSGRYKDAEAEYAALTKLSTRADFEINHGVALSGLGRDEEAIRAYQRAMELDAGLAEAQLYVGNALLRLGREDEAVGEFRRFLGMTNGSPEAKERIRRVLEVITGEEEEAES
jgi:superkiller protein 3